MTAEEPEVTTISEKGQVVIPQSIRKETGDKAEKQILGLRARRHYYFEKTGTSKFKERVGRHLQND